MAPPAGDVEEAEAEASPIVSQQEDEPFIEKRQVQGRRWRVLCVASVLLGVALPGLAIHMRGPSSMLASTEPRIDRNEYEHGLTAFYQERVPGDQGMDKRSQIILEFLLDDSNFNARFDWTYPDDNGHLFYRHGERYNPPWGWARLAINVHDSSILHESGGWVIAYHGTGAQWLPNIMKHGLLVQGGNKDALHGAVYGTGIYVSPNIEYSKLYAKPTCVDGRTLLPVFSCRVRPYSFTKTDKQDIWLVHSTDDIICTSIMFKVSGPEPDLPCQTPRRNIVENCWHLSMDECCSNQDRWPNRCVVVKEVTAPQSDVGNSCQSAHFVSEDVFEGQIVGCPGCAKTPRYAGNRLVGTFDPSEEHCRELLAPLHGRVLLKSGPLAESLRWR
eukprot:CAMPEP_0203975656 /NCGR_PEP_ID=MMETSP0359-20131031/100721_1 /ASSEMBLY_ACC=CAM_ASM_000338 /TAXON_ID=268821 /ORGANISM="Scrippsiella Hangoei, Strain SHTV-5" /LENGTH=386 /DNA_ID=CAMNT_0050913859 /DNA_START=36 /DNA_END=1196 /DNA_ORIENTATION=+